MMIMPEQLVTADGGRVLKIDLFDFQSPVRKGSIDFWVSMTQGGLPVSQALFRTIVVADGRIKPPRFYWQDVLPVVPKSKRLWLVGAYGPTILMTAPLRIG